METKEIQKQAFKELLGVCNKYNMEIYATINGDIGIASDKIGCIIGLTISPNKITQPDYSWVGYKEIILAEM